MTKKKTLLPKIRWPGFEPKSKSSIPINSNSIFKELTFEHQDRVATGGDASTPTVLGASGKPVLLKRGLMTTIEEYLLCAEYILATGNEQVILCERGIRTFDTATRNTLDVCAVPVIQRLSHLPIIVDPSHATGDWHYVIPMARAAVAAGADGLMIEVHPNPALAFSDGPQSLTPDRFDQLMREVAPLAAAVGRKLDQHAAARGRAEPS